MYFVKILLIYRFSHMWFGKRSGFFSSLTRHSRSRKQGRLGHVIGTRETSRGRSLIHFIWFLTTWITVKNSNKCVFVLISMLGRLKNSHSSSCCKWTKAANQSFGSMMQSRFLKYMAFIALHGLIIIEHSIRSNKVLSDGVRMFKTAMEQRA